MFQSYKHRLNYLKKQDREIQERVFNLLDQFCRNENEIKQIENKIIKPEIDT